MLDRIRRKLFLSLKVMSLNAVDGKESDENAQQLKRAELMDILRKGSGAISREESGMDFGRFSNAPIDAILEESRTREGARDARMRKDLATREDEEPAVKSEETGQLLQDAEEEERRLLSGVAQVQSRLFEGQVVHRRQNNQQIAQEWKELQKRARVDRLVMVDGMHVMADYMGYDEVSYIYKRNIKHLGSRGWTVLLNDLFQTASEVKSAPKKRYKAKYDSEDWCIYCRDGGEVVVCSQCPRGTFSDS